MKRMVLIAIALILVLPAGADDGRRAPGPSTDARFEFLKSLAGTWTTAAGAEGMPGGTFEFRVTAGGHAVEEREFVGTPMEMVTLYHVEGSDLVATHYCMLGNQPRLIGELAGKKLAFSCDGKPGSTTSHDEEHVHAWTMTLAEDGTLIYDAQIVKAGQVTEAPTMTLQRNTRTAAR